MARKQRHRKLRCNVAKLARLAAKNSLAAAGRRFVSGRRGRVFFEGKIALRPENRRIIGVRVAERGRRVAAKRTRAAGVGMLRCWK